MITEKRYKCQRCGHESKQSTNHYGYTYSFGHCNTCPNCPPWAKYSEFGGSTIWVCQEKLKVQDAVNILLCTEIELEHIAALKENKKHDARIKRNAFNREKNAMLKSLGIKRYSDSLGSYYE